MSKKCPKCGYSLILHCAHHGEYYPELTNYDENVLELINTIKQDMQEVRKMLTDRPQLTKGSKGNETNS